VKNPHTGLVGSSRVQLEGESTAEGSSTCTRMPKARAGWPNHEDAAGRLLLCGIAIAGEKKSVRVFLTDHESGGRARPW
jgi:hypothetical protein